ncbi:hypothetical protein CB0940_12219 [Cercospora beticola]|uniref:Uncharacterized protein n=1 Tax=Cercospora beticola TaxID=122368 RepID=A0A2G5GKQ8_CERBT|nr:hypothetical protein CB0940_12219 [Cercospora beticola]PIA80871.1 hypothetical protein CB0940_12219 [Cercospora beticola]WPB08516.1 hypothetical protein RHO25_013182 [Cercospora beticola]CAK1356620.1 unnamed protein product [Cercospora beticola]
MASTTTSPPPAQNSVIVLLAIRIPSGTRTCTWCHVTKPKSKFWTGKVLRDGWGNLNKTCDLCNSSAESLVQGWKVAQQRYLETFGERRDLVGNVEGDNGERGEGCDEENEEEIIDTSGNGSISGGDIVEEYDRRGEIVGRISPKPAEDGNSSESGLDVSAVLQRDQQGLSLRDISETDLASELYTPPAVERSQRRSTLPGCWDPESLDSLFGEEDVRVGSFGGHMNTLLQRARRELDEAIARAKQDP